LKKNLLWARTFDTIEELRAALVEFAKHYNETWLVAATVIVPQPRCE
jgi:putative transposase